MATISINEYKKLLASSKGKSDTRSIKGEVTIGGITFFARSTYEANIAAYFEYLKGAGEIIRWEHEPHTFWFEKIRRGTRSYLPDFRITRKDGSQYYVEVKGWMDPKSRTKLKRMAKYYPKVELQLIDHDRYAEIKKASKFIKDWGKLQ